MENIQLANKMEFVEKIDDKMDDFAHEMELIEKKLAELENESRELKKLQILVPNNAMENNIRLPSNKLKAVEKIDKMDNLFANDAAISPITIKLIEEKLAKLENENRELKETVEEINGLKKAIDSTNNELEQQKNKVKELEEKMVIKMRSEKCDGLEKEFGGIEQEIEEKGDWEIVEMEEEIERMKISNDDKVEALEPEFAEIVKKCEQLEEANDVEQLALFLESLSPAILQTNVGMAEPVLRARAMIYYHKGNFKELYSLLESHNFSFKWHHKLQHMWNDAHYQEEKQILGREGCLGPVEKYRIRKRFPCPLTIENLEMTHRIKEITRETLYAHYLLDPYPNPAAKKLLADKTGLTPIQVGNWFTNRRQRDRAAMALYKISRCSVLNE